MKNHEVLVTKTDGKLEFIDVYNFSCIVILDDTGNVASVWVNGKVIGKIYDSDIDRVRDRRREIIFERDLAEQALNPFRSSFLLRQSQISASAA